MAGKVKTSKKKIDSIKLRHSALKNSFYSFLITHYCIKRSFLISIKHGKFGSQGFKMKAHLSGSKL